MQDQSLRKNGKNNTQILLGLNDKTLSKDLEFVTLHRKSFGILCSTPISTGTGRKDMEIPFSQNCNSGIVETEGILPHTLDGDSGYISHFQESYSQHMECDNITNVIQNNIYISEDALLEKPELSSIKSNYEEEEYEEFSHLFYLNDSSIIPSSTEENTSEKNCLSGLENDSDTSIIIYPVDQIIISENDFESFKNNDELNFSHKINNEQNGCFNTEENSPIDQRNRENCISPSKRKRSTPPKNNCNCVDENKENNINISNNTIPTDNQTNRVELSEYIEKLDLKDKQCELLSKIENELYCSNLNKFVKEKSNSSGSCLSPELFTDDDETTEIIENNIKIAENEICTEKLVDEDDEKLLKRVQNALQGVFPPPSVTIIQISADELLNKIYENNHLFLKKDELETIKMNNQVEYVRNCNSSISDKSEDEKSSLDPKSKTKSLLYTCDRSSIESVEWPELIKYKYHGLLFNKGSFSEDFEHFCQKYGERYVGVETQSTCTVFSNEISPYRRRTRLKKVGKSPGKRLSHLARRRITFTKDSLQSSSSLVCARSRQILIDARKQAVLIKSPRKSPRKSPKKSPRKRRTPNSSMKKKSSSELFFRANVEASTSTYCSPTKDSCSNLNGIDCSTSSKRRTPRRALFTSPKKISPQKGMKSLYSQKKSTPKRALFMSPKKDKKRKRNEEDDDQTMVKNKLTKTMPCTSQNGVSLDNLKNSGRYNRTGNLGSASNNSQNQELTEHRKKKLLWAVSEALRSQNISMGHSQFKIFASVLARVTRRLLPNLNVPGPRPEGSTSELMLRIARQHVFAVTRGKTVDEIIQDVEKAKMKLTKPTVNVAPEQSSENVSIIKENVLKSKTNANGNILTQSNQRNTLRNEKVERIRRAINFSECEDDDTENI